MYNYIGLYLFLSIPKINMGTYDISISISISIPIYS